MVMEMIRRATHVILAMLEENHGREATQKLTLIWMLMSCLAQLIAWGNGIGFGVSWITLSFVYALIATFFIILYSESVVYLPMSIEYEIIEFVDYVVPRAFCWEALQHWAASGGSYPAEHITSPYGCGACGKCERLGIKQDEDDPRVWLYPEKQTNCVAKWLGSCDLADECTSHSHFWDCTQGVVRMTMAGREKKDRHHFV